MPIEEKTSAQIAAELAAIAQKEKEEAEKAATEKILADKAHERQVSEVKHGNGG